jgi:hypothetical protein
MRTGFDWQKGFPKLRHWETLTQMMIGSDWQTLKEIRMRCYSMMEIVTRSR